MLKNFIHYPYFFVQLKSWTSEWCVWQYFWFLCDNTLHFCVTRHSKDNKTVWWKSCPMQSSREKSWLEEESENCLSVEYHFPPTSHNILHLFMSTRPHSNNMNTWVPDEQQSAFRNTRGQISNIKFIFQKPSIGNTTTLFLKRTRKSSCVKTQGQEWEGGGSLSWS